MINKQGLTKTTRITICKYDTYQSSQQTNNEQVNEQITNKQRTDNEQITTNKNAKNTKNIKKVKNKQKDLALPAFVDQDLFNDYLIMRKQLKKPATDRAKESIVKKLLKFESVNPGHANKSLEQSIINSWQDVYQPRDQATTSKPINTLPAKTDYSGGF